MRHPLWIAAFAIAGLALLAAAGAGAVWLAERRKREVFPSSQAQALLNPLRRWVMPARETLARFGLASGQTVLEVGPGPGYYSLEASRMLRPGGRLICLDLQRGMLEILATRMIEAGVDNAELVIGDGMQLPFREGSVDAAFLVTVLGEIPDQRAALSDLRRVLRLGGALGFSESLGDPDIVFPRALRGVCGGEGFIESGYWRNPVGYTMVFHSTGPASEAIE